MHLCHEDPDFLVIDKPSGLLCQPGLGPDLTDSILTRLRSAYPWVELVHRLDRDTSGLLMVALNPTMHRHLSRLFAERAIQKHYLGVCEGVIQGSHGALSTPIGRLSRQPPRYGIHPEGRTSLTLWRCLTTSLDKSRLSLTPLTGRSHQLRVHLASLGHPLVGDPIYGEARSTERLHLHAEGLRFRHPITGIHLDISAPCPF